MGRKLYSHNISPPTRAVYLAEKALEIDSEKIKVDLSKENDPIFEKLNPQKTIPTLVDEDGTVIWESHAIMSYLVEKYGKDDSLYPKDLAKRAVVDQRMYFETEHIFSLLCRILMPILNNCKDKVSEVSKELAEKMFGMLEIFLEGHDWIAGYNLTIADFSIIASLTSLNCLIPIPPKYNNILKWIKRMEALPYYNVNSEGLKGFKQFVECLLK